MNVTAKQRIMLTLLRNHFFLNFKNRNSNLKIAIFANLTEIQFNNNKYMRNIVSLPLSLIVYQLKLNTNKIVLQRITKFFSLMMFLYD